MDVLAKLMDYNYAKHIENAKSQYYSLYLTTVGLFDVYVSMQCFHNERTTKLLTILL